MFSLCSWDPSQTKGFSEEMKIIFMGMFNTMNKISQEASAAQGRDVTCQMRDIVRMF